MIKRKRVPPKPLPSTWTVSDTYGDHEKGQEFTFEDHPKIMRRARLVSHVDNGKGHEWINCIEVDSKGDVKTGAMRSIHPTRIRKWWRKQKAQPSRKQRLKKRREA